MLEPSKVLAGRCGCKHDLKLHTVSGKESLSTTAKSIGRQAKHMLKYSVQRKQSMMATNAASFG